MGKPLTAKQRTIPMPGVDMRESRNAAVRIVDVRISVWRVNVMAGGRVTKPPSTHLRSHPWSSGALCGFALCGPDIVDPRGVRVKVCMACRVEAAKNRAVIR